MGMEGGGIEAARDTDRGHHCAGSQEDEEEGAEKLGDDGALVVPGEQGGLPHVELQEL